MAAESIADVLKTAYKKYDLHVGTLTSFAEEVPAITTGNIGIDKAIGIGGLPFGRCVELFGPPSSGKTTTAIQAAAELQKIILAGGDPVRRIEPDDVMVYCDYEHAFDIKYARALGIDVEHPSFLFAQPDWLEQGANVVRQLVATGKVRMVIFDSVAAMTPQAAMEAETGKANVALQARGMSDFLKAFNPLLHNNHCVGVFVNHIMELLDMGGGRKPGMPARTSTPGGRALKFYASVRVEYQQVQNLKSKVRDPLSNEEIDQVTATNVRVRVIKNKVAPPFRQAVVRVRYGKGFDNFWTALQVLISHKKIVYSSGYYYFERSPELVHPDMDVQASGNKRPYVRGETTIFTFADEHVEWRELMITAASAVLDADSESMLGDVDPDPEDEKLVSEADLMNVERVGATV